MKGLKLVIAAAAALFFTTHGIADSLNSSNTSLPDPTQDSNKPGLSSPDQRLSKDDIRRFVTAIAVIKRYYIRDVPNHTLFDYAMSGMVSSLDPHSTYLDKDSLSELQTAMTGEFSGIGVELTTQDGLLKVISPLEGTPAYNAGIKANDLIIKINGMLVQNMKLSDAINRIKGERGTKVDLTIIRKGVDKPITLAVTRDTVKLETVKTKLYDNGYGYIRISFFQGPLDQMVKNAVEKLKKEAGGNLKGLVIDLRNNPGGLLDESAKVCDLFLDSKTITHKYDDIIVYTKGRMAGSSLTFKATPGQIIPGVPMVVLINLGSASASEIMAGALQDYKRAIIMGTRSFGKGSVQTVIPISNDSAIKLTTALYHTPNGRVIQANGIIPNVRVPELSVNEKKIKGLIDIDEDNLQGHIQNNNLSPEKTRAATKAARLAQEAKDLALAKEDYQLYEAVTMLKGMYAMQQGSH